MTPQKLYRLKDIATIFGVSQQAVSNWRRRSSGPELPDPMYVLPDGTPLFTEDQIRELVIEHAAHMERVLGG